MSEEQEKNNEAPEAVTNGNEDEFSLDNLKSHFESCIGEDGSVYIDKYLLGKNSISCLLYITMNEWMNFKDYWWSSLGAHAPHIFEGLVCSHATSFRSVLNNTIKIW